MHPPPASITSTTRLSARRRVDARGCEVSGAAPGALDAYERALAAFQCWRGGADAALAAALQESPTFVMAHVLRAWMQLGGRDPRQIRAARPLVEHAATLAGNERERAHLAAMKAVLADDYNGARLALDDLLRRHPRDALALQMAHAYDYLSGDVEQLRRRVAGVLPVWSSELPGYAAVLAMHAFGLEESGAYAHAEDVARTALALNPANARVHHVMAHVFEMTGRADAGALWMTEHRRSWELNSTVATHCWWHLALFRLRRDDIDGALALYDRQLGHAEATTIGDLIDAAALLWRVRLHGADAGARWSELALAWSAHLDDGYCSFSDLHAMLAFVGAQDWGLAARLIATLEHAQAGATRHGATTRSIGLPACRALLAHGRGDDRLAVTLLASLPAAAHRIGGSHAQRDLLRLTLDASAARLHGARRRPAPRQPQPEPIAPAARSATIVDAS